MSDEIKANKDVGARAVSNRRRLLKMGAASVPAIVSLQAGTALATTGMSISMCEVVILPQQRIDIEGLDPTTSIEQLTLNTQSLMQLYDPGSMVTNNDAAYVAYLDGLADTDAGFSCINSLNNAFRPTP